MKRTSPLCALILAYFNGSPYEQTTVPTLASTPPLSISPWPNPDQAAAGSADRGL